MIKFKTFVVMAAMASGLLAPLHSHAETLNDALRWAYQDNPDLKASRAEVKRALAYANAVNAAARPQLNFSSTYNFSSNQYYQKPQTDWIKNDTLSATISASLLLYDGGQSGLATDSELAKTSAARYRLLATEQQVLLLTVEAYLNVLRYRSLASSSRSNISALNSRLASARVAFDAGAATVTELSQTEAAVAQAKADLASIEAQLKAAEADYKSLTQHAPGELAPINNLPALPSSLGQAQQIAVQSSPLVMAALEAERSAHLDLRRAQAAYMPKVNMQVGGTRTNSLDGNGFNDSVQLGVGVDIPLYTGGRNEALERQAAAVLESRANETNSTRLQAEATVAQAWAQLQNANSAIAAMKQVVEAQSLADQGAEVEYDVGALTVTDRLATQQDLISAKANLLTTQYDRQLQVYHVLYRMGQLTIDEMNLGIPKIDPLSSQQAAKPEAPPSQEAQAVEQISDRWAQ